MGGLLLFDDADGSITRRGMRISVEEDYKRVFTEILVHLIFCPGHTAFLIWNIS